MRLFVLFALVALAGLRPAFSQVLITEVLPGVVTSADSGDTVELFNAGVAPVDLTNWVLTDLDPASVESSPPSEGTFAPPALALPVLAPGDFAVVQFVDSDVVLNASFLVTNYGLRIRTPLATAASSFLGNTDEQLLLLDAVGDPRDFVAWYDTGDAISSDSREDIAAVTLPTAAYGLDLSLFSAAGTDAIANDAEYHAAAIDFTGLSSVSTYGGGALRRRSTNGVFQVTNPTSPADWEAIPRDEVRLGNPSDRVPTASGFRPIRITDSMPAWFAELESTLFPDRRIARFADQMPSDFLPPSPGDQAAFQGLVDRMLAGQFEEAFADAVPLGYEVVEFLDEGSGETFMLLREQVAAGRPGFRGQGTFVVGFGPDTRPDLCLQAPHPVYDSLTLDELGLAIPQLQPRWAMVAGTHRNNATTDTLCDGQLTSGVPYRVSDVAHATDSFFHAAHRRLEAVQPTMTHVQLHGFCCPGDANHPTLTDDVVASNGIDAVPAPGSLVQVFAQRLDAQNYMANGDLTTTGVFGDTADELGATNNIQGRITNGVAALDACDTAAITASDRFLHIEQDPDVRDDPQHVITALAEALDLTGIVLLVDLSSFDAVWNGPDQGPRVRWSTSAEIDSLGFVVYRAEAIGPAWRRGAALNDALIPAIGNPGADYWFDDPKPLSGASDARAYFLEELDGSGRRMTFGPAVYGGGVTTSAIDAWGLYEGR
ncbi:lamin tail domain-containing protein [bacterium]|nr:lamin tail domain-containing protein [bacterium]